MHFANSAPGANPNPEPPSSTALFPNNSLDGETPLLTSEAIARVRGLTCAIVAAPHLRSEREDCLQEALVWLWQTICRGPHGSLCSHLGRCGGFIRNKMRLGTSIDSPKRRWCGCSFDSNPSIHEFGAIPDLVCCIDPAQHARVKDDIAQMCLRLETRQRVILELLLKGNGTREVARQLRISPALVSRSATRIHAVAIELGLGPARRN